MEALKNFTGYRQRLFLTNDLNKWVRGGTPDLKWRAWLKDFFGLEIFDSGIFFGWCFIYVGIFCVFKPIWSCHSYVIDETEDVLGCLEWCLGFVRHPRVFWGGVGWFCPNSIIPSLEIRSTPLENWVSKKKLLHLKWHNLHLPTWGSNPNYSGN